MNKLLTVTLFVALALTIGGCRKRACLDSCEPSADQMQRCAQLDAMNRRVCERSVEQNAETCRQMCEENY